MKYFVISTLVVLVTLYGLAVWFFYAIHVNLLFHPEKLPVDFEFSFNHAFEEVVVEETAAFRIHGIHFKTHIPLGVVLYLHGNASQ